MANRFSSILKHAWNVFSNQDTSTQRGNGGYNSSDAGMGSYGYRRPDRLRPRFSNDKTIIPSIYTRLAIDMASIDIRHVRLDDEERYVSEYDSGLNNCLKLEANIDQTARAFIQDIAMTLFDSGCAAVVPVDTTLNPMTGSYDITTLRVGTITAWFPDKVRVNIYNEKFMRRQEITLPKSMVAIIENPLYSVMNEPNSTLQRLFKVLNNLDAIGEQSASGKLDLIIQLPYVVKSETRKAQAESRRKDIEFQLKGSQYGVAYTDGTEKITQLNRPVENNLMAQVEYLTTMLYGQLGITDAVMNGTADEKVMLNYWNRTIEPLLSAITIEFKRKFLTKTARTQNQSIIFFHDPFKLVPVEMIADIIDKTSRNEVVTANEWRAKLGFKPSSDPKADQLVNSNMPIDKTGTPLDPNNSGPSDGEPPTEGSAPVPTEPITPPQDSGTGIMAQSFDQIESAIDDAFSGFDLPSDSSGGS